MSQAKPKSPFEFTGGNVALDFVNTVNGRIREDPEDLLTDYDRLIQWAKEAALLKPKVVDHLLDVNAEAPGAGQAILRQAVQLREAMYDVFLAAAKRRAIPATALAAVNKAVQNGAQHAHIVHADRHFQWEWILPENHLDSMLWPIARAAAELLVSDDLQLVRQCAADDCAWLFVDKTKNHRRRWCEMKTCGNRDKARRYYQRQKAG